jgi:D-sedoheptulose 7-phosphate isomerase
MSATDGLADHRRLMAEIDELIPTIEDLVSRLCQTFQAGGRVYTFGNGGSAADAQHLAAELIGRYRRTRRPLPAVSLSVDPSVVTCIGNDFGYEVVFARQVEALAVPGDVVIAFSTSGRSESIVRGLEAARLAGATTVLLTGGDGGPAMAHADISLVVPATDTARVQEVHVLLLHLVSDGVDRWAERAATW